MSNFRDNPGLGVPVGHHECDDVNRSEDSVGSVNVDGYGSAFEGLASEAESDGLNSTAPDHGGKGSPYKETY